MITFMISLASILLSILLRLIIAFGIGFYILFISYLIVHGFYRLQDKVGAVKSKTARAAKVE